MKDIYDYQLVVGNFWMLSKFSDPAISYTYDCECEIVKGLEPNYCPNCGVPVVKRKFRQEDRISNSDISDMKALFSSDRECFRVNHNTVAITNSGNVFISDDYIADSWSIESSQGETNRIEIMPSTLNTSPFDDFLDCYGNHPNYTCVPYHGVLFLDDMRA